jgi:3-hydroxyisobutyrate dehydrogenase
LAKSSQKDGVILDIGVTDPVETIAMASELEAHGWQLVDAPSFGSPQDAKEGKLAMVVGGADGAVERCRPVLETLAASIIRAGAAGSAQAAVALADYVRVARLLATSEAIRLGGHFGFEPTNLLEVCDALGGAGLGEMLAREVATRRFRTGLQLGVVRANVALAERMAGAAQMPSPMLAATRDALVRAEAQLGYSMDHSAVIKWLEALTPPRSDEAKDKPDTKTGSV